MTGIMNFEREHIFSRTVDLVTRKKHYWSKHMFMVSFVTEGYRLVDLGSI